MPKLHHVTIPDRVFAELQHCLAKSSISYPFDLRVVLAMLIAPMIGHIRMYKAEQEKRPAVLEWSSDVDARARDQHWELESMAVDLKQVKDALRKLHGPPDAGYIDLFLDLSVDPTDESLSIDITMEPVLEGEDLIEIAAASSPVTSTGVEEFSVPFGDTYFTAAKAAELLGVDKSTVTRRIRNNELIGFRIFKNSLRIPREQFKDGDVVDGIADVLALFESHPAAGDTLIDHKAAWAFLSSTVYPGDAAPRPIDRLRTTSFDRPVSRVLEELALAKQSLDFGDHI